jgi:hypothetical protein
MGDAGETGGIDESKIGNSNEYSIYRHGVVQFQY